MAVTVKSELPSLSQALTQYQILTGKTWGDIMANEARSWAFALYEAFSKLSPPPASIFSDAQGRGFSMGRRGDSLTKSAAGFSLAAVERAKALLDGDKSDWFRVEMGTGTPRLKRVRFSKFVRGGERRLLIGGRFGNKFAAGSLRASQVEQQHLAAAQAKSQNLRHMNLRAVATAIEIGYRARAARGHLMGNQWLPEVYKRSKSAMLKVGPLVSRSSKGFQIGRIDFLAGPDGEPAGVSLTAYVQGTEQQANEHGIPAAVEAGRASDRMAYVRRKLAENAVKSFLKQ